MGWGVPLPSRDTRHPGNIDAGSNYNRLPGPGSNLLPWGLDSPFPHLEVTGISTEETLFAPGQPWQGSEGVPAESDTKKMKIILPRLQQLNSH